MLLDFLPVALPPSDYVLDFTNELERHETEYWLYFKKVLWFRPLKFESAELVNLLYNQVSIIASALEVTIVDFFHSSGLSRFYAWEFDCA